MMTKMMSKVLVCEEKLKCIAWWYP